MNMPIKRLYQYMHADLVHHGCATDWAAVDEAAAAKLKNKLKSKFKHYGK